MTNEMAYEFCCLEIVLRYTYSWRARDSQKMEKWWKIEILDQWVRDFEKIFDFAIYISFNLELSWFQTYNFFPTKNVSEKNKNLFPSRNSNSGGQKGLDILYPNAIWLIYESTNFDPLYLGFQGDWAKTVKFPNENPYMVYRLGLVWI